MNKFDQEQVTVSPEYYREWLKRHNLDHRGAAAFFGVSAMTSIRWSVGESMIPFMLARLLDCMHRHDEEPGPMYQIRKKEPKERVIDMELKAMAPHWQRAMDEAAARKKAEAEEEAKKDKK